MPSAALRVVSSAGKKVGETAATKGMTLAAWRAGLKAEQSDFLKADCWDARSVEC